LRIKRRKKVENVGNSKKDVDDENKKGNTGGTEINRNRWCTKLLLLKEGIKMKEAEGDKHEEVGKKTRFK
jgi:hypothetical protein